MFCGSRQILLWWKKEQKMALWLVKVADPWCRRTTVADAKTTILISGDYTLKKTYLLILYSTSANRSPDPMLHTVPLIHTKTKV